MCIRRYTQAFIHPESGSLFLMQATRGEWQWFVHSVVIVDTVFYQNPAIHPVWVITNSRTVKLKLVIMIWKCCSLTHSEMHLHSALSLNAPNTCQWQIAIDSGIRNVSLLLHIQQECEVTHLWAHREAPGGLKCDTYWISVFHTDPQGSDVHRHPSPQTAAAELVSSV